MPHVRKHAPTIAVSAATAVATAAVVTGGPALAAGIFADDSHKVDGFHAVGAKASADKRAGKLVATNRQGLLPDSIMSERSYLGVEVFAVRGDGSIRNQSDPAATITRTGAGQYCIDAPGAQEGAVGVLQNSGGETAGTIRISMGIGSFCNNVSGADITVETFSGNTPSDQRFSLMYPVAPN